MLCSSSISVSAVGRTHTCSVRVITAFVVIDLFGSPALHLRFFCGCPCQLVIIELFCPIVFVVLCFIVFLLTDLIICKRNSKWLYIYRCHIWFTMEPYIKLSLISYELDIHVYNFENLLLPIWWLVHFYNGKALEECSEFKTFQTKKTSLNLPNWSDIGFKDSVVNRTCLPPHEIEGPLKLH